MKRSLYLSCSNPIILISSIIIGGIIGAIFGVYAYYGQWLG